MPCTREFTFKELPAEETKTPIKVVMMTQATSSLFTMAKFVLEEYYTFSQAVFSWAKTISSVKQLRREFAPFADCIKQSKSLSMKNL